MSNVKKIIGLLVLLVITFAAAFIGSRYMPGEWYAQIAKPSWTPPNAIFGPVWTILYIMMAIAAWLVWRLKGISGAKLALLFFVIQLILNALWSYFFFGRHDIVLAFIDIVILWLFILLTLIAFWKQNKFAGILLIPYLLWVSFASVLNFSFMYINIFWLHKM